jgi:localization factor PodJL
MTSRRNVYDGLNANRTRRGPSALDDLERTLNGLEQRVGSIGAKHQEPVPMRTRDDFAERFQQLNQQFAQRTDRFASAPRSAGSLSRLANDIERARHDEESFHGLSAVSAEINRLRADIRGLAERPADRSGELLRRELEELKRNVSTLAREDTLRSVGRSWEQFERRPIDSDPAFTKLANRLEDIQAAVETLPQSLSMQSMEEKVRVLATAIDTLSRQNPHASAEHLELIESRLDEISRAIVATSVSMQPAPMDYVPFERLEARLAALAERVEAIGADDTTQALADHVGARISSLSDRFDALASASQLPEEQIARLASHMEVISRKIESVSDTSNADAMMQGLENRLYEIASAIDKKSRDATDQTLTYFRDLEGRLQDLTVRLEDNEQAASGSNPEVLAFINDRFADFYAKMDEKQRKAADPVGVMAKGLESRLDDITRRLDTTAASIPVIDTSLIRDLEAQVQNLSLQLDRPASGASTEFDDISPRLAAIEKSLTVNRETLLDAARMAAEDALRNMALPAAGDINREAVIGLANDLKSLEAMARKADDRNSRTFEAIHDTLLKVVDRLSAIETDGFQPALETASRAAPAFSPLAEPVLKAAERSIDFGSSAPSLDPEEEDFSRPPTAPVRTATRSPAAAAAAAAAAAGSRSGKAPEPAAKTSMFSGLAKAVRGSREPEKAELVLAGDPLLSAPGEEVTEIVNADQPLEPGSGAPDLNSIMQRVREERNARGDKGTDSVVKSDLIAAARRAAQAAAAEAEILKKASGKTDLKQKAGISELISKQRKPIFMAISALIVALAGLQFGRAFLSNDTTQIDTQAAAAIEAPADPLKVEADAGDNIEAPATAGQAAPAELEEPSVRLVDKPAGANDAMMAPGASAPAMQLPKTEASAEPGIDSKPSEAAMTGPDAKSVTPDAPATAEAPKLGEKPAESDVAVAAPDAKTSDLPPSDAGPIALREAAASGDPKALFEIGSRYAEGRGVAKDLKEAAKYYTQAADSGFAPAQFRIGSFHEKGLGVERDASKAKTFYQMAAEQGNASAMHNLAVLFAMGAAGPADNDSAAEWFNKAAEFGVKDSQYNLGILAAKGLGVKQSLEDSYKWFALAAKAGDKDAASKRDEIANAMRPEQLAKARAAADLWKAKVPDAASNGIEIPESWREAQGQTASINKADMKKAVLNIQLILAKNGYDVGTPDGVMGGKTKKAIAAYQAANGMKATGEVDEQLVKSLLAKAKEIKA